VKIRIRSAVAGAAVALVTTAGLLAGTGTAAFAATPPAWEPDAAALGFISFFDASGAPITSGSLDSHPMVPFSEASGPGRPGDTKAQLKAFTPQVGVLPPLWSGDTMTGATDYPNASAPPNIAAMSNPVVTGAVGDFSMNDYISEFPNNLTQTGYQNLYELRLYTSGPGQSQGTSYYRVDILVDPAAGTWSVAFPAAVTPTNTTISANPPSPANSGAAVTLTAHVTPLGTAGSVDFKDGAVDLGTGSYNAATGDATLVVHPADGAHSFTAAFTPTDPTAFGPSASAALPYTVLPAGTPTHTALSANPPSPATGDASGNATVMLTATVTPGNLAGNVEFFDGASDLGPADSYVPATGIATKSVVLNAAGSPHLLTATFTPTDTTFSPSTSLVLSYTVLPVNFGTAGITLNAQDNTQPFAGTLSLSVTTTTVDLTQVDPNTPAGHPVRADDPTGHRHAWVFDGTLTGVSVNDTRQTEPGWTVTGQASPFVNGATTYSSDHLGWTPALVGGDAEGTVTAGSAVDSSLKTFPSQGLSVNRNLASAAVGSGLGTENLSASLDLRIPDTSPTGLYASTLTLTLISP